MSPTQQAIPYGKPAPYNTRGSTNPYAQHVGASSIFTFAKRIQNQHGPNFPLRAQATITSVTSTHVILSGHADTSHHTHCARCAKRITNPVSIFVGFGPDCSELLGISRPELSILKDNPEHLAIIREVLTANTSFTHLEVPASYILRSTLVTSDQAQVLSPVSSVLLKAHFLEEFTPDGEATHPDEAVLTRKGVNYYPATPDHAKLFSRPDISANDDVLGLAAQTGGKQVVAVAVRDNQDLMLYSNAKDDVLQNIPGASQWGTTRLTLTPQNISMLMDAYGNKLLLAKNIPVANAAPRLQPTPTTAAQPTQPQLAPQQAQPAFPTPPSGHVTVTVVGNEIHVAGDYKTTQPIFKVPFRTWDGALRVNKFPKEPGSAHAINNLLGTLIKADAAFTELLKTPPAKQARAIVTQTGGTLKITSAYEDAQILRSIAGGKWNKTSRTWDYPATPANATELLNRLPGIQPEELLKPLAEQLAKAEAAIDEAQNYKTQEDLPDIPGITTTAWNHQRQAFHFAKNLDGALLNMGMGTGKSLTCLGLIAENKPKTTIVLAPKRVLSVWPGEAKKHGLNNYHVLPLTKSTRQANLKLLATTVEENHQHLIVVLNYEAAWRPETAKALLALNPEMLVMDEIHRIKNPTGKASKFAYKLSRHPSIKFRLGLTGTFMPHGPTDAFAQMRAINPDVLGTSHYHFLERYAVRDRHKAIIGYKNVQELNHKLLRVTYRAGNEVLDLPPLRHETIRVQLKPSTKRLSNELLEEIRIDVGNNQTVTAKITLTKLLRLQQITSGFVKADDGSTVQVDPAKRDALKDMFTDIDPREPLVIFCVFHEQLELIKGVAAETGRTYSELSGRKDELKPWQDGETDVIGVQIRSGGLGVDLTRARIAVFLSTDYSLGNFDQAEARIFRPGQKHPTTIYHLIAEDTIDEDVYAAIRNKRDIIRSVLGS